MFISNNRPSFHLWWKENLVKHQNVSKYYKTGCSFYLFKIKNYFSCKDPIPNDLKSFLVYKFVLAVDLAILAKLRHFKTRIDGHIKKHNKFHIFNHLHSTAKCFDSYNFLCFKIIDKAHYKLDLKKLYILTGENLS